VGHLKRGKSGRFGKTIFYFLRADIYSSCTVIIKGKAVNLGDGYGMQVPCKLKFFAQEKYVEILQKELKQLQSWTKRLRHFQLFEKIS
jgi:uncharacterized SAM-dependent methyltransferase